MDIKKIVEMIAEMIKRFAEMLPFMGVGMIGIFLIIGIIIVATYAINYFSNKAKK